MTRLALALALAACSSPSPPPAFPKDDLPTHAKAAAPAVPDTIAGHQLQWVIDTIVAHAGKVEAAEIDRRFAPAFLAQVPADQVIAIFAQLGDELAGMTLAEIKADSATHLVARATVGQHRLQILLDVDAKSNLIDGLLLQPDAPAASSFKSFAEAKRALAEVAPHASLLVAAVDGGACTALEEVDADRELAIGSAFKLYVLLGLADQLIAGAAHWNDAIAVRDDWKSLPSGITQNDAAGTKLPLRMLAERMISISDNTATDHVLATIGRAKAETALREAKHAKPALDTPFLSTREMFLLKLQTSEADNARYLAMTEAQRRNYLDHTLAGKRASAEGIGDWKTARQIDKLEWFASGSDLCNVMATLQARAADPKAAGVLDVLAKNPGIPLDAKTWPYIGYKGGSEPGVLDLTWLLRRADGRWFVVSLTLNSDEHGEVNEERTLPIAAGVIERAAKL